MQVYIQSELYNVELSCARPLNAQRSCGINKARLKSRVLPTEESSLLNATCFSWQVESVVLSFSGQSPGAGQVGCGK